MIFLGHSATHFAHPVQRSGNNFGYTIFYDNGVKRTYLFTTAKPQTTVAAGTRSTCQCIRRMAVLNTKILIFILSIFTGAVAHYSGFFGYNIPGVNTHKFRYGFCCSCATHQGICQVKHLPLLWLQPIRHNRNIRSHRSLRRGSISLTFLSFHLPSLQKLWRQ